MSAIAATLAPEAVDAELPSSPPPAAALTAPAPQPRDRAHLAYLDGLRAVAALYVVLHHAWMIATIAPGTGPVAKFSKILLERGHVAVDLFIVLSGFCLMIPVARRSGELQGGAISFFKRRARRILPPYFFAMVLSLLAIVTVLGVRTGTLWDDCIALTPAGIVTHVLLIHELFYGTAQQINNVFWSVAVEWKIYFLFPLLVIACRRWGALIMTVLAIVLSYVLLIGLRPTPINAHTGGVSAHYIGLFAMGMLAAQVAFARSGRYAQVRERWPWTALLIVVTVITIAASKVPLAHENLTPFNDFFVGIWSMALLVTLAARERGMLRRMLSWAPLAFLGTFAYSIYLIHLPLLQFFWQYLLMPRGLSFTQTLAAMCAVAAPITVGLSYLFFFAFERPFLSTGARRAPSELNPSCAALPA